MNGGAPIYGWLKGKKNTFITFYTWMIWGIASVQESLTWLPTHVSTMSYLNIDTAMTLRTKWTQWHCDVAVVAIGLIQVVSGAVTGDLADLMVRYVPILGKNL